MGREEKGARAVLVKDSAARRSSIRVRCGGREGDALEAKGREGKSAGNCGARARGGGIEDVRREKRAGRRVHYFAPGPH